MIATPAVPLLVIDGALHLEIGGTRYRVEDFVGSIGWMVSIHNIDNDKKYQIKHYQGTTTCNCPSFQFGRKLKGTNERVYGSCKHTEKVSALVDVLRALRGGGS